MAFPVVETTSTAVNATYSGTSFDIAMPSGVQAGDLLMVISSKPTTVTGVADGSENWTAEFSGAGTAPELWVKIATGNESSQITITWTSALDQNNAVAYRISGWKGDSLANDIERSYSFNSNVSTVAFTSHTLSGWAGTEDTLWVAAFGMEDDATTVSTWGSNIPNNQTSAGSGATNNANVSAFATANSAASSFTPDSCTVNKADDGYALTVAVRPAAAAAGFTTNLESLTTGEQSQITGLISALNSLAKAGLVQGTGLVTAIDALNKAGQAGITGHITSLESLSALGLQATFPAAGGFTSVLDELVKLGFAVGTGHGTQTDALTKAGQAASTGHGTLLDSLTAAGLQATFPGVASFPTILESLTKAGQSAGTGHGTALDSLTALGLNQSLGAVGELTTVLASLTAAGQAAALGLITILDSMTVTERAQALGFITSTGNLTALGYNQSFGGAGFTTVLKALSAAGLEQGITIWQLGDALMAAYEDLPGFFDTFGFAEPVQVGAATVRGLFDDSSMEGGEIDGPLLILQTGDVDALGIDQGTVLTIRGRSFYVAGVQRDGVGTSTAVLREPS